MRPALQQIGTRCVKLRVEPTERVVNGSCAEDAYSFAFFLLYLEPLCLDDDTEAFYEEYAAKNGVDVADSLRNILADINHASFWGEPIDESMCEEAINKYKSFSNAYGINLQDVIKTLEGVRDRNK